ncbi:hypothetical protein ACUH78_08070 [Thauera sp. ZXT1-4]|uniref:hypothetical protein n=1 Tax=Thauera sp. ZXT1-4 TaxID=3460294 RepID=UPI0040407301
MSTEKQFEFAERQLRVSAESVGIDLDVSEGGLLFIHDAIDDWQQDFSDCPEYSKEADRLWKAFGDSPQGREVLRALGEACALAVDTWRTRTWEDHSLSFEAQGWDSLKSRAFVDYAMSVGIAAIRCVEYANRGSEDVEAAIAAARRINFSELGAIGAAKRHTPMKKLREWTVEQYRAGEWPSANKAAHDLKESVMAHGRTIGANLSPENAQRTIAEWMRKSA